MVELTFQVPEGALSSLRKDGEGFARDAYRRGRQVV